MTSAFGGLGLKILYFSYLQSSDFLCLFLAVPCSVSLIEAVLQHCRRARTEMAEKIREMLVLGVAFAMIINKPIGDWLNVPAH